MEDEKDRCDVAKLEGRIKTPFQNIIKYLNHKQCGKCYSTETDKDKKKFIIRKEDDRAN